MNKFTFCVQEVAVNLLLVEVAAEDENAARKKALANPRFFRLLDEKSLSRAYMACPEGLFRDLG